MADSFPKIVVRGDSYEKGCEYGEQARAQISKCVNFYGSTFKKNNLTDETIETLTRKYRRIITDQYRERLDEMRGIADGSGFELDQIVALNCRTEILQSSKLMAPECTVFAVTPEASANGHAYIGQNWDWFKECTEFAIVLEAQSNDRPDCMVFVEAGMVARNGMNSAGIGVVGNGLTAKGDAQQEGIPIPVVRRSILECESYGHAVEKLICTPRASSANYILADKGGIAINFEMIPNDFFQMNPDKGILSHANHFIAGRGFVEDVFVKTFPDSVYRYQRVNQRLHAKYPQVELSDLKDVFRDHFGYPRSICRHSDATDGLGQFETVASIIMDLTEGILYVSKGTPCNNEYKEYVFTKN